MARSIHILSEDDFAAWKGSLSTEAVMAAVARFAETREGIAKGQIYESADGDPAALQRMFANKEAVRLSNEFISDFVALDYAGYRQIVDDGAG